MSGVRALLLACAALATTGANAQDTPYLTNGVAGVQDLRPYASRLHTSTGTEHPRYGSNCVRKVFQQLKKRSLSNLTATYTRIATPLEQTEEEDCASIVPEGDNSYIIEVKTGDLRGAGLSSLHRPCVSCTKVQPLL